MTLFQRDDSAAILDALSKAMAIIEFRLDGTILDANENFLKTVGYSLAEIKGKHHSLFVEPEYAQGRDYREFWAALNRGEPKVAEFKRLAKGGREIWLQASYNPIFDGRGQPVSIIKFATDITRSKTECSDTVGKQVSKVQESSRSAADTAIQDHSITVSGVNQAAEYGGSASADRPHLADAVSRQVAGLGARLDDFLRSIQGCAA